jgi:NitT/TauT family transport system ATP-binding protein
LIRIQGLGRRFANGTVALDAVNATIKTGEFVALLGPSGCGKSTLLRLLAGLDEPDQGSITWPDGAPPAPGEIGFVFQDATLLPWANAAENVYLPLRLMGQSRSASRALVGETLARLGLAGFETAKPAALSGGMRMRVSIARALVSKPKLLLMDEPFAALDEFTRHRLQADLLALWREAGTTIIFVTHSIYEAAFLASCIYIMTPRPGRITAKLHADLPQDQASSQRRTSAAYTALVGTITETLQAVITA